MKKIFCGLALLIVFCVSVLQLLAIIADSFVKDGRLTLINYTAICNPETFFLILKSTGIALAVACLSTLFGSVHAFLLTKTDMSGKEFCRLIHLIPLFLSPYIVAVSWVDFFIMFESGPEFIYSPAGVIFVLSIIFTPLAMIIISSGLKNLDSRLEEAGLMLTSYSNVILKIVMPLIRPALVSSLILIFVLALSEFSVPAFLSVNLLTTEIFTQFSAFYNYDAAVAYSMILIALCVSLLFVERLYLADAPFISIGSRSHSFKTIELKNKIKFSLMAFQGAYLSIVVIIPIIVLTAQSLQGNLAEDFLNALYFLMPTIADSLLYAALGALLLCFFGFVFAYLAEREKIKSINIVLLILFGIPSTVLGIALIKFFNTPKLNFIYGGFWIIIIGYFGRFIFIAEKLISSSLKQIPVVFEEVAHIIGASLISRSTKILFPILSEGLFSAFLICFIFCLGELGTTILVYPPGGAVMPIRIYTIMANSPQHITSAMCLMVMVITLIALAVLLAGQKVLLKRKWVVR